MNTYLFMTLINILYVYNKSFLECYEELRKQKLIEDESYIGKGERGQLHATCLCDDENVFTVCHRIKSETGIGDEFGSISVSYPASIMNKYRKSRKEVWCIISEFVYTYFSLMFDSCDAAFFSFLFKKQVKLE
jgi:hypothetical protein